jgi:hypothetical protein
MNERIRPQRAALRACGEGPPRRQRGGTANGSEARGFGLRTSPQGSRAALRAFYVDGVGGRTTRIPLSPRAIGHRVDPGAGGEGRGEGGDGSRGPASNRGRP